MSMLIRFLLGLGFILLNGLGYAHADTNKTYPDNCRHFTASALIALQEHQTLTIRPATWEAKGDRGVVNDVPDSEDEEDDEPSSFKKHAANGNYFSTLFHGRSLAYNTSFLHYHSSSGKHLSYSSCGIYIVYRVIRI